MDSSNKYGSSTLQYKRSTGISFPGDFNKRIEKQMELDAAENEEIVGMIESRTGQISLVTREKLVEIMEAIQAEKKNSQGI